MSEDDNFQLCAKCAKKQMCEISWKTNFKTTVSNLKDNFTPKYAFFFVFSDLQCFLSMYNVCGKFPHFWALQNTQRIIELDGTLLLVHKAKQITN